jgi:transcriptional regulator with XRE-family HTH domain
MEHIGQRIRYWRRRRGGMSQRTLAGLAGVSQGFISQVETGVLPIDRRSTLVAIAKALQITVVDLLGQPGDPTDPNKAIAAASVPEIRVALAEVDAGDARPSGRSRDQVAAALAVNDAHRLVCDFASAAPALPGLLRDSAPYGPELRSEVLHATASLLRSIGYRDLAWRASDMALAAAREAENLTLLGATQFMRLMCMPTEASTVIGTQARHTYEELQQRMADPGARRGYGAMHLAAALAAAQADRRADIAAHLDEAGREAATLGEPIKPGGLSMSFGPTNVGLWAMSSALELGEYRRVVELAQRVHPEALPHANRQCSYWVDYGRALSHIHGREREAVAAFARAEAAAPQYVKVLPAARNAVASMIARAKQRAIADDLRRLADNLGLRAV